MFVLYILLAPLFSLALFRSISQIASSIKEGNKDKLKADIFFLSLIIVVSILLVLVIEYK